MILLCFCHCIGVSQRHLEQKVLHAEHAHLCSALPTSEILPELYSASAITLRTMDEVDAASTRVRKNGVLLRKLGQYRRYPVSDLCRVLDKFRPLKYLAKDLREGQL